MHVSRRVRPFLKCKELGIQGCTSEWTALALTSRDGHCSSHLNHMHTAEVGKKEPFNKQVTPKTADGCGMVYFQKYHICRV